MFDTVCVVGVGLIGGSFGIALREKKLARQVIGAVRRKETINAAFQKGAVDNATTDLAEAARGADLVLLAPPVGQIKTLCEELSPVVRADAIVTDAGSTKSQLVEQCTPIFGTKAHFIGGHPMAGSERTGVEHARADLFEGAIWILTPIDQTSREELDRLKALVEAIGAIPFIIDPETHDQLLAVTSHLPHLTAAALVHLFSAAQENHDIVPRLIAGGWRDSTRVAAGSPEMWRDICLANAPAIGKGLDELISEMQNLKEMLEAKNGDDLHAWFEAASKVRRKHGYFPRSG